MPRLLPCVLGLAFVTGCEAPNVFRGGHAQRPHAILVSENPPGFRGFFGLGREVTPHFVNQQPTAFWRNADHFRLPPGPAMVGVIDVRPPYGYEPIGFVAVHGHRYILRPARVDGRDVVTLSERLPGTPVERVIATARRNLE